jgi:hypothetical protein
MLNPFNAIDSRFELEPLPPAGRPVFILAAGWRSGSTLLQRLAMSSGEILLWGEPYGRAGVVPALSRAMLSLQPEWPAAASIAHEGDLTGAGLHEQWIANLYPEPRSLRDGLRAMLDAFLASPARRRGFARFGLKEVRFGVVEAWFLRWLFPDARFVFLVRNPWHAWSSMKGSSWYLRWPDQVVATAAEFAHVWNGLAGSFTHWSGDAGALLRYEDVVRSDWNVEPVRELLGVCVIDAAVLANRIRGIARPPIPLDGDEIAQIDAIAGATAAAFGYSAPR